MAWYESVKDHPLKRVLFRNSMRKTLISMGSWECSSQRFLLFGCYQNQERGNGIRERGTRVWERPVSGIHHKKSKGRTK